jgi:hypothetical protein
MMALQDTQLLARQQDFEILLLSAATPCCEKVE